MKLPKSRKPSLKGELGYERIANDAYMTPPHMLQALLDRWEPDGPIWEPACGTGNLAKMLLAKGYDVVASDLNAHGFGQPGHDFLKMKGLPHGVRTVLTNPPNSKSIEFVLKGLELTRTVAGAVAMLMPSTWDTAKSKIPLMDWPFSMKLTVCRRPLWVPGVPKANPRVAYAWYIWDWEMEETEHPIAAYIS